MAIRMLLDDVGSGATVEPAIALEHHQLFFEHRIPLWNRDEAFGTPLAASMQEGTFCPFTFPMQIHPSATSEAWYVVSRLFVAGFFAFLFFELFVCAIAAFAGAVAFMLTGYFVLFVTMPHLNVECLIPLSLFATERLVRRPDYATIAGLAVAMGLVWIGGFPESTVLASLLASAYFVVRIFSLGRNAPSPLRTVGAFVAASLIGVGASAMLMLPFAEFAKISITSHVATDAVPRGISDVDGSPDLGLGTYLVPLAFGPLWHGTLQGGTDFNGVRGFWGIVAFFLGVVSIVALAYRRLDRKQSILAIFGVAAATVFIAKRFAAPEINWIGYLPILRQIVFNKYAEPVIGFWVAALCAIGLDVICGKRLTLSMWIVATVACLGTLSYFDHHLGVAAPAMLGSNFFHFAFLLATAALMACAALSYVSIDPTRSPLRASLAARAPGAFVLLLLVELTCNYYYPMWFALNKQPNKETNPYVGAPYVSYLREHIAPGERVFAEQGFLWPDWPEAFDLPDVRANEAIYTSRYLPFVQAFIPATPTCDQGFAFTGCQTKTPDDPLIARFLALGGVRYIVTNRPLDAAYRKVFEDVASVYRTPGNASRAQLFHSVRFVSSGDEALGKLTDLRVDVNDIAYVEQNGNAQRELQQLDAPRHSTPDDRINVTDDSSQHIAAITQSERPGLLMLKDTYYPGWEAYVDGKRVPIANTDYLFRGVFVDAGRHVVDFRYEPTSFRAGIAITAVSLALIIVCCIMAFCSRPRFGVAPPS